MTRDERDSLVEIMSKVQICETRGSILSLFDKLLRVIDISENSIMIPTLLKDKCEFDANELLIMGRILKASILGHNDLVEFYMSESSSTFNSKRQQQLIQHQLHPISHQLSPLASSNNSNNKLSSNKHQSHNPNNNSNSNSNNNHHHQHQQHPNNNHHSNSITSIANQSQLQLQSTTPSLASSSSLDSATSSLSPTPLRSSISDGLLNLGSTLHSGTSNSASSSSSQSQTSSSQMITHASQIPGGDDPDITVRLLLQIEHLKIVIPQITNLYESVIELYKNSVDDSFM